MATTNYGWVTPRLGDENNPPADLSSLAAQVDASMKTVATGLEMGVSTPYPVTWAQIGGTVLSVGNGTLTGRYIERGKWIWYSILLERGSTSNTGSAAYTFTLPTPPRSYREINGSGNVIAGSVLPIIPSGIGSSMIVLLLTTTGARVSNTAPGSWAAGHSIVVSGFYERQ